MLIKVEKRVNVGQKNLISESDEFVKEGKDIIQSKQEVLLLTDTKNKSPSNDLKMHIK